MTSNTRRAAVAILMSVAACSAASPTQVVGDGAVTTDDRRPFDPTIDGRWIGNGISYGAYRDGEGPGKALTSKAHILEDLEIIAKRWNLIRLYGSDPQARNILEVIRDNDLPVRVMQGIWLDRHKSEADNDAQVRLAIELANQFPEIVAAVNVGNEIFVDWSAHRLDDMAAVVRRIKVVRASIRQPVTVSDDYNFWNKPRAKQIADEVDFICLHAYAFWNNKTLDVAMAWTESIYRDIQGRYPGHQVAYCETGWPTSRVYGDGSYEGGLIGKAGESEQGIFFDRYDAWVRQNKVSSFYFSSFDERWKGGFDGNDPMAKAEKHWGLYKSDRTPKQALRAP